MIVADRLVERIKARGISYTALAREVGVQQPTISRLVKGEQTGTKRLPELAHALRTTPEYLRGTIDDPEEGADTGHRLSSDELEWVELYARLTLEQRKAIRTIVRGIIGEPPSSRIHDRRDEYGAPDHG